MVECKIVDCKMDYNKSVDKSSRNGDSRADIGKSDGIKTVSTETQESRLQVR